MSFSANELRQLCSDLEFDCLEGTDDWQLEAVGRHLELLEASQGEIIFHEGDDGRCVYYLVDGVLGVLKQCKDGDLHVITQLNSGTVVGEIALLDGGTRSASVCAVEASQLLSLSRDGFNRLLAEEPRVGLRVMQWLSCRLAGRLRLASDSIVENENRRMYMQMAAHDLKTPLHVISGFSGLILAEAEKISAEKVVLYQRSVQRASRQMVRLVQNLVLEAQLDGQGLHVDFEPVSLIEVCSHVVEGSFPIAAGKEIDLELQAGSDLVVKGDSFLIHQVIENLVSNAIKFSPPGSRVIVAVVLDPLGPAISVTDSGPGIPVEDRAKLFAKFSRIGSSTTGGEGSSGLGLWIAGKLVERLGARIWHENIEPGMGSRFVVSFPTKSIHPS